MGLQQGPAMSIFTDRSKWTSICSLCVDKLKKQNKTKTKNKTLKKETKQKTTNKKNPKTLTTFIQDFIKILRNTIRTTTFPRDPEVFYNYTKTVARCGPYQLNTTSVGEDAVFSDQREETDLSYSSDKLNSAVFST